MRFNATHSCWFQVAKNTNFAVLQFGELKLELELREDKITHSMKGAGKKVASDLQFSKRNAPGKFINCCSC